jgi:IS5 family transposase
MEQDTTVAALRAHIERLDAAHKAQAEIAWQHYQRARALEADNLRVSAWQHYQRAQALEADNLRVSAELAEARTRLAALEAKP